MQMMPLRRGAALAPMAGATDKTMRRISAEHGAVCTVSEMISAKALTMGDQKSPKLVLGGGGGVPYGVQLFGHEPAVMAEGARLLLALRARRPEAAHFDFIDINMGCPAPKITGPGAGSALLKNPALAGQVAHAVVQAVAGEVPVTVKLRIGWDAATLTGPEVAKRCEEAGVSMLTVHGRTRQEMYEPGIHAGEIARVKAAVGIPVWANGDVTSAQGALALLAATGCDGVAVGRGAMGNPWLFGQIAAALAGQVVPPAPPLAQRLAVMRCHVYELCEDKGEYIGMREARSHAAWYLHGLRGAAALRRMCCGMEHFEDLDAVIARVWEYQREEAGPDAERAKESMA